MKRVEVEIRSVYGNVRIYPVNDAAKLLAKIAGTSTLSNEVIKYATELGFEVYQVPAYSLSEVAA